MQKHRQTETKANHEGVITVHTTGSEKNIQVYKNEHCISYRAEVQLVRRST